jgi:hypothetical protein
MQPEHPVDRGAQVVEQYGIQKIEYPTLAKTSHDTIMADSLFI